MKTMRDENWVKYFKCNECWEEKPLTKEFWIRDKRKETWFTHKCKICSYKRQKIAQHKYNLSHKEKTHEYNLKYRQEHRDEIREKRRWNREKENIKRRERMKEISDKIHKHNAEMGYNPIHQSVCRLVKKLWIRPKVCSICWYECKPVAHHPDYNKPYEIIFCCKSCHQLIHLWQLEINKKSIITLCESSGRKQIIKCIYCWENIYNIWGARYCKKCKTIARKESQKRFREKKKLLNLYS